jgi:hypothetical protein
MITYHEINEVLGRMSVLDGRIRELKQMVTTVCKLSDEINLVNDELTIDREHFSSEIRAVEVLQEILTKHVYKRTARTPVDPVKFGDPDTGQAPIGGRPQGAPEPNGDGML